MFEYVLVSYLVLPLESHYCAKQRIMRALNIMTELVILFYFRFLLPMPAINNFNLFLFGDNRERANNFHRRRVFFSTWLLTHD